jgi:hypothetical protein
MDSHTNYNCPTSPSPTSSRPLPRNQRPDSTVSFTRCPWPASFLLTHDAAGYPTPSPHHSTISVCLGTSTPPCSRSYPPSHLPQQSRLPHRRADLDLVAPPHDRKIHAAGEWNRPRRATTSSSDSAPMSRRVDIRAPASHPRTLPPDPKLKGEECNITKLQK